MSKFTPGPWKIIPDSCPPDIISDTGKRFICTMLESLTITKNPYAPDLEMDKNAQLIAAAPELYEACKLAYDELSGHPEFWMTRKDKPGWSSSIGRTLMEALAKAEGGEG